MDIQFTTPEAGVLVVRYESAADLQPEKQKSLVSEMRRIGSKRRVGIFFVLSNGVVAVDPSVPRFWLDVVGDRSSGLTAIAIASPSLAVRVAASGFGVANRLRGRSVAVKAFLPENEREATAWVRAQIAEPDKRPESTA